MEHTQSTSTDSKRCARCGEFKPLAQFYRLTTPTRTSSHRSYCKECHRPAAREFLGQCAQCGVEFRHIGRHPRRFCSAICIGEACLPKEPRPSHPVIKPCARCGAEMQIKPSHAESTWYCSKTCMAADYRDRLRGDQNPNFRGAGWHTCIQCGQPFHNYNKARKYCSHDCYVQDEMVTRVGHLPSNYRVDHNQAVIVEALEKAGASVIDCSQVGGGMCDLIVGFGGVNYLVEVKNPTHKWRLTPAQKRWMAVWPNPIHIVQTVEEALALIGVQSAPVDYLARNVAQTGRRR
jgi:hypothetical protein